MDPNETYNAMMVLVAEIHAAVDAGDQVDQQAASNLANHVDALDKWIRSGGFVPRVWNVLKTSLRQRGSNVRFKITR